MKFLLATALFTAFSVHAAAPVICEGTQDGKQISFSMERNDLGQITTISAEVNGEEIASFSGNGQVVVTEHVYGTVVHGRARLGDIKGLMVLLDNRGNANEGWISYYGNLSASGVNLTCQF